MCCGGVKKYFDDSKASEEQIGNAIRIPKVIFAINIPNIAPKANPTPAPKVRNTVNLLLVILMI